jgi:hypothetical protein
MLDQHFFASAAPPAAHSDVFGPLEGGERGLWQGRCAVAEYAFEKAASLPRWVLPENTEVLVTDRRVLYAYTRSDTPDDLEVTSGELRWLWPQHLRVQPGARTTGRAATAAQIQLVCAASDGSFPALVFAGGDLATVGDADRLANLMRQAIARFRVDNAKQLGLSAPQSRMLSRLLIGPEFSNFQGGAGQTVTLLGALSVHRPAEPQPPAADDAQLVSPEPPAVAAPVSNGPEPEPVPTVFPAADYGRHAEPGPGTWPTAGLDTDSMLLATLDADIPQPAADEPDPAPAGGPATRLPGYRPGLAADEARALQAAAAEQATHRHQPDLASRAADLAARVASFVAAAENQTAADHAAAERAAAARAERAQAEQAEAERARAERAEAEQAAAQQAAAQQAAAEQADDLANVDTTDLTARAAAVRRAAARFAANSAHGKAGRRPGPEVGTTSRGRRAR